MEAIRQFTSKMVYLDIDHLDNNDIIPTVFAKKTTKNQSGQYLFNNLRYLPGLPKRENPNFPLNDPRAEGAEVLIPGNYFASESEYDSAVWTILDYGFKAIISNEFGHQFKINAYRNGLLPIELKSEKIREFAETGREIFVDLPDQKIVVGGKHYSFYVDPDFKDRLIRGAGDVQTTLESYENLIHTYEENWDHFYQDKESRN